MSRGLTDVLARQVSAGLAAYGQPPLAVAALGVRDELSADELSADELRADDPVDGTPGPGAARIHLTGHQAVVGPFAVAGAASGQPCPRCLARRWQAVRPRELRDALELGGVPQPAGEPAVATAFVADHVAALAAAHTSGTDEPAVVYQVDLDRLTVRRHHLLPDPECPACGPVDDAVDDAVDDGVDDGPATTAPGEFRLEPAPKPRPDEFRARELLGLDLPVDALANPVCGAVGPVLVRDLASVSTAATAGGFTTRSGTYLRQTLWGGHADSYAASARIGLLEGLERYAGIRARSGTRRVRAALDDLGETALDPRACGLYSDDFHARHVEVDPFSPSRPIDWVPGHSLRDDRQVLVPEVLAHYQTPDQRRRFVQSTSSGCATGSSLTEAVYHGLMEVVERDAFLIAWYAGLTLPKLDVRTSARASTRRMVDRLAMHGYDAWFLDTRVGFRIPVVTAVAVRRDGGLGALCVGGGASLDPEAALAAALCEIATDAVNLRHRTIADEARLRAMSERFDLVAELHDHPLAFGIPEMAAHARFLLDDPADPAPLATAYATPRAAPPLADDLREDLAWSLADVTSHGFDVIVVDQTMPEQRRLGLATVNVIVPGLVPIDFGWDRQRALHLSRVRTAPRAAGLIDHDLTDEDLHRVPHPFP